MLLVFTVQSVSKPACRASQFKRSKSMTTGELATLIGLCGVLAGMFTLVIMDGRKR